MRFGGLAVGSFVVFTAFAVACASKSATGSSQDDQTATPPRTDTPATTPTAAPTAPDDTTDDDSDGGDTDGGTTVDEGGTVLMPGDGGTACAANSLAESEPNDTAATANQLPGTSSSFCGRLPTKDDVDFATFTMPADKNFLSTGWGASRNGITITITVDGQSFAAGTQPIVKPGSTYVIKVSSTSTSEIDYRVQYAFEN